MLVLIGEYSTDTNYVYQRLNGTHGFAECNLPALLPVSQNCTRKPSNTIILVHLRYSSCCATMAITHTFTQWLFSLVSPLIGRSKLKL